MSTPAPKLLPPSTGPRLIVYHQTFHDQDGTYHSLLPLLTNNTGITHVIIAAIHLNDGPGNITLNDHRPHDKRFEQLWGEVSWLQGSGVKVLGMLGGAAKGSYEKLGGSDESVCFVFLFRGFLRGFDGFICLPSSSFISSSWHTSFFS